MIVTYILTAILMLLSMQSAQQPEFRGRIRTIDWHPDGNQLIVTSVYRCGDSSVEFPSHLYIVDATTNRIIDRIEKSDCLSGDVEFSPNGSQIAYGAGGAVFVTDSAFQRLPLEMARAFDSKAIKWNEDGSRLVTTVMGATVVLDPRTGEQLYGMDGHAGRTPHFAWSADYTKIVSDDIEGNIRIWDASTGETLSLLSSSETFGTLVSLDWHPTSSLLAVSHLDAGMVLWDTTTWSPLVTLPGGVFSHVQWNPDGSLLAAISRTQILLWNPATESVVYTIHSEFDIYAFDWKPDGSAIAYGGDHPGIVITPLSSLMMPASD